MAGPQRGGKAAARATNDRDKLSPPQQWRLSPGDRAVRSEPVERSARLAAGLGLGSRQCRSGSGGAGPRLQAPGLMQWAAAAKADPSDMLVSKCLHAVSELQAVPWFHQESSIGGIPAPAALLVVAAACSLPTTGCRPHQPIRQVHSFSILALPLLLVNHCSCALPARTPGGRRRGGQSPWGAGWFTSHASHPFPQSRYLQRRSKHPFPLYAPALTAGGGGLMEQGAKSWLLAAAGAEAQGGRPVAG